MFGKVIVPSVAIVLFASQSLFAVKSPDGFAVWSEGTGYERTLYKLDLTKDTKPDTKKAQKITDKGPKGGDIMSVISYDGKWVAFCRDARGAKDQYGPNDYHYEEAFDLFIVRIDGALPNNNIIRVDEGTWPSWGREGGGKNKEVSGKYGPPYTLYYSQIKGGTKKCTISKDGKVSDVKVHSSVANRFKMVSPNGKFVAYYPGHIKIRGLETGNDVADGNSFSCHPSFGSDSYWVLYARNWATNIKGKTISTGIGEYHYGTSNDMEWAISRRKNSGNDQNTAHEIGVWKMEATEDDITFAFQFDVGMGNFPDIHVTTDTPVRSAKAVPDFDFSVEGRGVSFSGTIDDLQTLEIFDINGRMVQNMPVTSRTITLQNANLLPQGIYLLRLQGKSSTIVRKVGFTGN